MQRIRVAVGEAGDELVPTEAEAEHAAKEAALAAREAERAARLAAEGEVERLRALVEAATKSQKPKPRH